MAKTRAREFAHCTPDSRVEHHVLLGAKLLLLVTLEQADQLADALLQCERRVG